ncbi:hypothetical protein [Corynebacterium sp. 209RC1]|uniref:hypothetical protein n=2 Tax=Corynebacterium TaxID=1716 RepID=UPI00211B9088|nr:hypothetical protein [Corynebacterium sp. 209RC1]MCQ9365503.1 hypothetical protein [Corynebacterium sp. 70RC1]
MMSSFSKAEREAMKARAEELRTQKGGNKRAKNLEALEQAIEAMPAGDKEIAIALHQVMSEVAPQLYPRTWYGMPAYENEQDVVVFLQVTSKFDTRYTTLGFNPSATLDDGEMWPTHYAIPALTEGVKERMKQLVKKATGA